MTIFNRISILNFMLITIMTTKRFVQTITAFQTSGRGTIITKQIREQHQPILSSKLHYLTISNTQTTINNNYNQKILLRSSLFSTTTNNNNNYDNIIGTPATSFDDGKCPFEITTPIYYVNDKPHIGHAYTSVGTFKIYKRK